MMFMNIAIECPKMQYSMKISVEEVVEDVERNQGSEGIVGRSLFSLPLYTRRALTYPDQMICKHNCEKLVNGDVQVIIEGQYIEMFALHWNQVGPQCVEDERDSIPNPNITPTLKMSFVDRLHLSIEYFKKDKRTQQNNCADLKFS